jgi:hypothetical protein
MLVEKGLAPSKKPGRVTRALQKVVNAIDKLSTPKKKKINELSATLLGRYVTKAAATGSKLDLSPYGKRSRGIFKANKKIDQKKKINEGPYDFSHSGTVLSRSKHLAAKDHPCEVCKGTIKKNEVHNKMAFISHDGKFKAYRYHGNCTMSEDAPTNAMGASSTTSGPIQTFDPMLKKKKMLKRKPPVV